MRPDLSDALVVLGAAAIGFGLYHLGWPLLMIFAGGLLFISGLARR